MLIFKSQQYSEGLLCKDGFISVEQSKSVTRTYFWGTKLKVLPPQRGSFAGQELFLF